MNLILGFSKIPVGNSFFIVIAIKMPNFVATRKYKIRIEQNRIESFSIEDKEIISLFLGNFEIKNVAYLDVYYSRLVI